MDLSLFAQLLNQEQKKADEVNPYYKFGGVADNIGNQIKQNAGNFSIGEDLVGGLIAGLTGGLFSGLGQDYADNQRTSMSDVLAKSLTGEPIDRPSNLPSSVFADLKNNASVFRAQQAAEAMKQQQDLKKELALKLLDKGLDNPYQIDQTIAAANRLLGGVNGRSAEPVRPIDSTPSANTVAGDLKPQADVKQKTFDDYMKEAQGNKEAAMALFKQDLEAPDKLATARANLRKEFENADPYKKYEIAARAYPTFLKALQDTNNPAADFEITKMAVQMIEPGLSVNQGEQAAVTASAAIPSKWKSYIVSALDGTTKLPDEVRTGLVDLAKRQYGSHENLFSRLREGYDSEALKQKLINPGEHLDMLGNLATLVPTEENLRKLSKDDITSLITQEAKAQGVDPEAALSIAERESSLDPLAKGSKGEIGLFQLMPDTAKGLGIDPTDITQNIKGGIRYFKQNLDKYGGDVTKALQAYNAGPGAVDRGKIPGSTQDYTSEIERMMTAAGLVIKDGKIFKKVQVSNTPYG